ncbi:hypothetical protein F3J34_11450 [Klebsiella sp. Ap-873]|nr:hypothetical protein [Klebsiella sp. Ap-873]
MEEINVGRVEELPDLSKCGDDELFQYSTVMDTEKLLTIQRVMNEIHDEYE